MEKVKAKKGIKVSYIPYVPDEMNDVAFSDKFKYRWSNHLKKLIEKDGGSIHTYDITPFEEADAILSFDNVYFQNDKFFLSLYKSNKLGSTTHIDYEPPSASCKIHCNRGLKKLSKLFKSLVTYNDSVINGKTLVKGNIGDFFLKELPYKNDFKKRKLVAIIANNRDDVMDEVGRHKDELYSQRKVAARFFQDNHPDEFDLYGDYWPDNLKKCWKGIVKRAEKPKVISKYRFLISYDSIKNQKGYISEKIFDCFKSKTVPIYWGADNVTDYIPKNCFIDKRDFDSYDDLYNFLSSMDEKTYTTYIRNIEEYLRSSKFNEYFSSEASARVLYNELKKPSRKINRLRAYFVLCSFEKKRWSGAYKYNYDNNYYDYHQPSFIKLNSFKKLQKSCDGLDNYSLFFKTYHGDNILPEIYYKYSGNFVKLDCVTKKLPNIKNGAITEFSIEVLDLVKQKKTKFYYFDGKKYHLLNLGVNFNWDGFRRGYLLKVRKNCFCYHITFVRRIARKLRYYYRKYNGKNR